MEKIISYYTKVNIYLLCLLEKEESKLLERKVLVILAFQTGNFDHISFSFGWVIIVIVTSLLYYI